MSLTPMAEILHSARVRGGGVGAFNVILLEHAEAYLSAAESAGIPVVLQISENCAKYHGGLAPIAAATLELARRSTAPVAVHLDHAEDLRLVHEAVELGFNSVMFDGSTLSYDLNLARTSEVVAICRPRGISVEAELGEVGGKDGAHAPGSRTDPAQARDFVTATGVDALAVAVGSSHAMTARHALLDESLIRELRRIVEVPLVLHGSSGVPDDGLVGAVRAGITKVNIATHLNVVFTAALRDRLSEDGIVDPRPYLAHARHAVAAEAARLLKLIAGSVGRRHSGRAAESATSPGAGL